MQMQREYVIQLKKENSQKIKDLARIIEESNASDKLNDYRLHEVKKQRR